MLTICDSQLFNSKANGREIETNFKSDTEKMSLKQTKKLKINQSEIHRLSNPRNIKNTKTHYKC